MKDKINKIELIKDTTKRDTEEIRIERINKLNKIEKTKTVIKELKIGIKFNKLANNLDIRLQKGSKKSILNIVEYVSNAKNLKIKPIDSNLKKKETNSVLL